jgi:hypothetical protein
MPTLLAPCFLHYGLIGNNSTVTCRGDYKRGFGSIDHFNTHLHLITLNYSAIANFHTLQIIRAHRQLFSVCHFTSPGNGSNNCYTSASVLKFSERRLLSNCLFFKKVKAKITLKLAVYRQSVRLGVKPLKTHDRIFFFN